MARLQVNLTSTVVDQLGSVDVAIRAFDAYDNEIPVPGSIQVDATGRATSMMTNSSFWTITTLDDGPQTITVRVGSVGEEQEIEVVGNLAGFFEAGGTLYYVGAGLLGLVGMVLLVLLVMFMRGGRTDEWDDDDEDDDDDKPSGPTGPAPGPTGPAPGPTGPAPGPSGPPPEEAPPAVEEEPAIETSVDEDGTEWWEDDDGTWWYRMAGEEEWQEYSEEDVIR